MKKSIRTKKIASTSEPPKTRIRVAAIIIQNNKLLMVKSDKFKELWTPGGKLEPGESDIACLTRELKEEIDVKLVSAKFFKEYTCPSPYFPNTITTNRIYLATISGVPTPGHEIHQVIWLSRDDIQNKKYPTIKIYEDEMFPDLIKAKIL